MFLSCSGCWARGLGGTPWLRLRRLLLSRPRLRRPRASGCLQLGRLLWQTLWPTRARTSLPPPIAPLPTAFDVVPHGRFDGEMGDKPEVVPP